MEYRNFCQWLEDSKNMTERSAKDVVSRCKRILKITGAESLKTMSTADLTQCEDFLTYSTFVRSQLKRALTLYLEYTELTRESGANF